MYIGTAGWTIPKNFSHLFPIEGSHLARYSKIFNMVEINSSFYREHQAKTYERWAREVPDDFRFSVKLAKTFTHECGFKPKRKDLEESLENIYHLTEKLGLILIQIPGSLEFDRKIAERFYQLIRKNYLGPLAIEPRHSQWMSKESQALLTEYGVSKVVADPERCQGGSSSILNAGGVHYLRLHGSPIVYRSSYSSAFLEDLSHKMKNLKDAWCVFDNTTFGFSIENALELKRRLVNYSSLQE